MDNLQWRLFFVPDYNENESIFIYKVHHSLADGIAIVLAFFHMTDEPRHEDYPSIMLRFSWLQDLIIKLMMPVYMLWLVFDILALRRPERNGYKTVENKTKLTAHKILRFIPDVPTDLIKKRVKELSTPESRITFNDILMTAVSKSIHDYLQEKTDDRNTKQAIMACPFSLRPAPKKLLDFEYNNDFAILPLKLRLVDNLTNGLRQINQDMNKLKKSMEPIGFCYLIKIVMQLPEFLRAHILEDFCEKITFGFSNVPGPKTPWKTIGKQC